MVGSWKALFLRLSLAGEIDVLVLQVRGGSGPNPRLASIFCGPGAQGGPDVFPALSHLGLNKWPSIFPSTSKPQIGSNTPSHFFLDLFFHSTIWEGAIFFLHIHHLSGPYGPTALPLQSIHQISPYANISLIPIFLVMFFHYRFFFIF